MFAVYDGHGGAEVATYCSQKLPDYIRACEAYEKGDLEEALKQAFLDLDSSLTKEEVVAELYKLAFCNESGMFKKQSFMSYTVLQRVHPFLNFILSQLLVYSCYSLAGNLQCFCSTSF